MPRQVFYFNPPERFVVGTVGQPGERTFFIQARTGAQLLSVALEKEQVAMLADRLEALLEQVGRRTGLDTDDPGPADSEPLEQPIVEEFRVATISLGWDGESQSLLIEAHAPADDPELEVAELDDDEDGPPVLRVKITTVQARGFVERSRAVVAAGRPPCPFCTLPLEPRGHICPRANGYRRSG